MRIAGMYSFKGGKEAVAGKYPDLLTEVNNAVKAVNADKCKTKE